MLVPLDPPITHQLTQALRDAIRQATLSGQLGTLTDPGQAMNLPLVVQVASDLKFGDYASPVALGLKKICNLAPPLIAKAIVTEFQLAGVEASIAGPGFLNFRLQPEFLAKGIQTIRSLGEDFGHSRVVKPEKILLEFVSANPTGPLHVGHGRWAAVGSTLANLLRAIGHQVECEFYINDAGNQMQILGKSLQIRVKQLQGEAVELPEDAYQGTYLVDVAQRLVDSGQILATLADYTDYGYQELLGWQQQTLQRFQTFFDQWFSERRLHQPDPITGLTAIQQTLKDLEDRQFLYRAKTSRQEPEKPNSEEATYFKTEEFGDDKDRVVAKADGSTTYLAADIAYHRDKVSRGYDRLINILGADHHGYLGRLNAAVHAFRADVELELMIGQFVKLFRLDPETQEKQEVRMSKRTGNFVSLNDLIDDEEIGVGVDAARWFLITTSMDTALNFDLDLAVKQEKDNPVFYVQYAHTRCCSLLRTATEKGVDITQEASLSDPQGTFLLSEPEARHLVLQLLACPDQLLLAAQERAPHKVTAYAEQVAKALNKFYDECPILKIVGEHPELAMARLQLVKATRQVLANLLTQILGISAPTVM